MATVVDVSSIGMPAKSGGSGMAYEWLGALANSAASIYGSYLTSKGAAAANARNIDQQDKANALTVNLANTAHQREVADLRAAGLNPILSAGGSGAASPQLQAATVGNEAESIANSASQLGHTLSRAFAQGTRLSNEQLARQNELIGKQADIATDDVYLSRMQRNVAMMRLRDEYDARANMDYKQLHELHRNLQQAIISEARSRAWTAFKSFVPFLNSASSIRDTFSSRFGHH